MILLKWLGRLLDRLCVLSERLGWTFNRAAGRVYRVYYRGEARKAKRASDRKASDDQRRTDAVIDDLIAETRPVNRVRAPIHRDR